MASLRAPSTARLLRCATPLRASMPLTARRFESSVATTSTDVPAAVPPSTEQNGPNYNITADKATSTFTPVPKKVQDGSEDVPYIQAGTISGAPMELQARSVRIYQETKPATQSGNWQGHQWRMDWDVLAKGHRWENPLMGWQSSGDFMQGTKLNFKSKEDAIHFAEKQGYEYFVQEPQSRRITPKAYANNFLYSPKKLKHIRTK
ncbi:NADH-ubiquinone oxidoreductase 21 kDa subunit [Colletotrichum trifolii]|uniref:NADH dehydrogenase [ubiquinone] iron-sulfur protein 4, mitochondrial n=1 Tax=Colletotrichum trifolii TaxID=5466 RepID=A0A4R8RDQ3_COLTR|nr:NADH-ubiquinone oxidoreductase 21 kDa subunit [Colletotrichum trifolii]